MYDISNICNNNDNNKGNSNINNISNNQQLLLYPNEVSKLLKVSVQTLRSWYKDGKLDAVLTPGKQMRIPTSEITRLLGRYAPIDVTLSPESYKGFEKDEPAPVIPDTSYLASLFMSPSDEIEAEAERGTTTTT